MRYPIDVDDFENPDDHVDPTQSDTAQIINPDGSHWP